jgi:3-carboxy-cis,cis-muconate cycloisomerase
MRRNLELSGPLLLSEGVSAAVAPLLEERDGRTGKQQLQDVVDRTLQAPTAEQSGTYRRLLREAVPASALSDEQLEELLDPASYLGQAGEISRRILAAFPDFAGSGEPPADAGRAIPAGTTTETDLNGDPRG